MHCPYCKHADTRVLDSRVAEDGLSIRRRRQCSSCSKRFSTLEQMQLVVVKRSGVIEPFSREKVITGVSKACKGRPVTQNDLARLGQQVEENLRAQGVSEIPANEIGLAVLEPLSKLDDVAYMRFASVYKQYDCLDDFVAGIEDLRSAKASE
ncbi:MAG: transcriptional regulator NrdR [Propionibacteriaceae bacterium]|nr:transcriptional regulator NrdR [Propionibacteriaceae bacterium]